VINAWVLLGAHVPHSRPAGSAELGALWDLGNYTGQPGVIAAVSFLAFLIGTLVELNPQRMWAYGGRPQWISSVRDGLRRGRFRRLRVFPLSAQARDDLIAYSAEEYGYIVGDEHDANALMKRLLLEERQLATRLQAGNADLFGRYDRLLAESAFRLNLAPPLAVLLLSLAWQAPLPGSVRVLLSIAAVGYCLLLFRQAVVLVIQARDVLAQALVAGIVASRSLAALAGTTTAPQPDPDTTEQPPGQPEHSPV
jgi:hypothetical protein